MKKLRVGVLADYLEEGWPSMDLVAEMTVQSLNAGGEVQAELIRPPLPQPLSNWAGNKGRSAERLLGRMFFYPREAAKLGHQFDIFHVSDHSYSQLVHALPAERCLVTCHDIDTFRCLLAKDAEPRPWPFRWMTKRILSGMQKAAHVTCDSESTAREIRQAGWIPEDKLSVTLLGASAEFFEPTPSEAQRWVENWLREKQLEGKPFLLHVGSTIARKRIDVLLRVVAQLSKTMGAVHLVRVGGALKPEQAALADELGIQAQIHPTPFLDRWQLRALYERANLVLQPSSYEGFGLPVVEAQASGAVVVASDLSVLREVGGAAAYYCPVGDVEKWGETVRPLLESSTLEPVIWKENRERSQAWAANFRWDRVAARLVQKYQYIFAQLVPRSS